MGSFYSQKTGGKVYRADVPIQNPDSTFLGTEPRFLRQRRATTSATAESEIMSDSSIMMRERSKMRILLCSLMLLAWIQMPVLAQGRSPDELAVKIRKDASERDLDTLMKSLSNSDGGNYQLVMLRGMTGSFHENQIIFRSVVHDERVRKIYEKLQALDKPEAAKLVTESFEQALADAKKMFTDSAGYVDPVTSYGLHAKLWLIFELGELTDFNRLVREWNNYSLQSLRFGTGEAVFPTSFPGPEMLMYLNLVYLEEKRSGRDGLALVDLIKEAGIENAFELTIRHYLITSVHAPGDSAKRRKLGTTSIIGSWNGLGRLNRYERAKLMRKAGALIDPGIHSNPFEPFVETWSVWVQKNIVSKVEKVLPKRMLAMELHFLGPVPASKVGFMARSWNANLPPSKEEFLVAINVIQQHAFEANCDDWNDCVEAIKRWVAELPDEGIAANGRRIFFQWPDEVVGDETPRIRLSMQRIQALNKSLEEGASLRVTHPKNSGDAASSTLEGR